MVAHLVEHGFDIWRRFRDHCIQITRDWHSIGVQERYDLQCVAVVDVDPFLEESGWKQPNTIAQWRQ